MQWYLFRYKYTQRLFSSEMPNYTLNMSLVAGYGSSDEEPAEKSAVSSTQLALVNIAPPVVPKVLPALSVLTVTVWVAGDATT